MPNKILIVTEKTDLHADVVIVKLRELGHDPIRIHQSEFPLQSSFGLRISADGTAGSIRTAKYNIDLNEIKSIWWRRPKQFTLPGKWSKQDARFARTELEHALSGLWATLDCYWMSLPSRLAVARYKPSQLKQAVKLGFEVPRTLITTYPEEAMNFYEECGGRIIFKVMSDPSLGAPLINPNRKIPINISPVPESRKGAYTSVVTLDKLKTHFTKIRSAPCQFQEFVAKQYELRVTIIGNQIFAAKINSQAQPETLLDWRHYEVPMLMEKIELPAEIADRCFALVRHYGLNFSAMDLIVTPDNRYVFLENNPNGQWYFVELKIPEYKMTATLADCLIKGSN